MFWRVSYMLGPELCITCDFTRMSLKKTFKILAKKNSKVKNVWLHFSVRIWSSTDWSLHLPNITPTPFASLTPLLLSFCHKAPPLLPLLSQSAALTWTLPLPPDTRTNGILHSWLGFPLLGLCCCCFWWVCSSYLNVVFHLKLCVACVCVTVCLSVF